MKKRPWSPTEWFFIAWSRKLWLVEAVMVEDNKMFVTLRNGSRWVIDDRRSPVSLAVVAQQGSAPGSPSLALRAA